MGAIALLFAVAAAAEPAPAPAAKTPRIQVTGTFKLNGVFTVTSALTDGTTVNASIFVQTSDLIYSGNSGIQAQAKVSAGKAKFTVTLPYAWLVAARINKVMVTVNLSANALTSSATLYYTSYLTKTIPLPKMEATTTVNFTGAL